MVISLGDLSHIIRCDVLINCNLATSEPLMIILADLILGKHLEFLMPSSSIPRTMKLLVVAIRHHDL